MRYQSVGKRAARGAFSLIEMTASLAAASLLVCGIGSTVYVASRATGTASSSVSSVVTGSMTAEQVAGEVQYAISFSERSSTATEFTVADRNGDGAPETIRFEWSGNQGDPIQRTYNGGTPQNVVQDVHDFGLAYRVQTVSTTSTQSSGGTQSAETLFASFDGWAGVTATNLDYGLSPGYWMSEYFKIDWPSGAAKVKITRVRLKLWQQVATGQFSVGIYPAAGGTGPLPASSPIGTEAVVSCSSLPATADWVDVPFSDVTLTDPSSGYNIVVKGIATGGMVRYLNSYSAPADSTVAKWTSNSGATWNPSSFMETYYDVPFYCYGTYTTSTSSPTTTDRYFVRSVGIGLQVGGDTASHIDTASETLNAPEVTSP